MSTSDLDFLALLEPAERERLRALGHRRLFQPPATLMSEGQAGSEVFLIESGRVKVSCTGRDGREVVLRFCGPGDLLGEIAVIDDEPRSGTVEALEPVSTIAFAATDFRGFMESHPSVGLALLRMITRRFRDADRLRVEFAASHSLGRVAARLVELAARYGQTTDVGVVIDLRISQDELAGWTGSSREAVAKALHTLRDLGLVVTERRRITILDVEGLARQAP